MMTLTTTQVREYYLDRVPGLKPTAGKQWRAVCPIHQGQRDSLSIDTETGRWFCQSECNRGGDVVDFERLLFSLDAKTALNQVDDFFGREWKPTKVSAPKQERRIVDTYDYRDENLNLKYQVVRFEPKGFSQRRPGLDGTWLWNLQGVTPTLYNRPAVDKAETVIVVEGEKDADTLIKRGIVATCNSGGAGKWHESMTRLLKGKDVVVIADDDERKDSGVLRFPGQAHGLQVATELMAVAFSVKLMTLPGAKDVGEWFQRGRSLEDLQALIAATPAVTELQIGDWRRKYILEQPLEPAGVQPAREMHRPMESADAPDPNVIGDAIIRDHSLITLGKSNTYEYLDNVWKPIPPERLESYALVKDAHIKTTARRRSEVAKYIMTVTRQQEILWRNLDEYEVPVKNGVIDVRTGSMRGHRDTDYLETLVPVAYDPAAKCPVWEKALEDWFEGADDKSQRVEALQQWFGYVLMGHARYKACALIFGPPNTGKSVAQETLSHLIGQPNCCSISVASMDDPRKLAPIRSKMLNVIAELPHDSMIADGGFKRLVSTGEPIQIDGKYKDPEMYASACKHMIVTNVMPYINDHTGGVHERLKVIIFEKVVPKAKQDRELQHKIDAELAGILNWALAGAAKLIAASGQFTIPDSGRELVEKHKRDCNPMHDFLTEQCHPVDENTISIAEVRRRYNEWVGKKLTTAAVRRFLRAAGCELNGDEFLLHYAFKLRG